jgi:(heptosyl)LPS beta-1,4-glucosyltransferase
VGDVDGFARRFARGKDILDDEHTIGGRQTEAASQDQRRSTRSLREDRSSAESACDLVSDDQSAQGRRQDNGRFEMFQPRRDSQSERRSVRRMLKNQCRLEVTRTVKPRRQLKMTFEIRTGPPIQRDRVALFHLDRVVYDAAAVPPVTATIITKNESDAIADALKSLSWADEIIVVDAESTDDTVAIARQFTDRVFVRPWNGYVDQKNHAARLASHDWIFSLDADERVPVDLSSEIRALLESEPRASGYRMPRVSFYLGRWMRTTDMYPDYQLRLYDRRKARWDGLHVHESVKVDGDSIGYLKSELQHYPYRDLSEHLIRMDRYTTLAAKQMFEKGKRATRLELLVHPPVAFLRNYILKGGFRDGKAGLVVSLVNSYYVMLKFAKLWELQRD